MKSRIGSDTESEKRRAYWPYTREAALMKSRVGSDTGTDIIDFYAGNSSIQQHSGYSLGRYNGDTAAPSYPRTSHNRDTNLSGMTVTHQDLADEYRESLGQCF